jgi:hypothetical protein
VDPMYCTLEQVKAAVNVTAPAFVDSQIVREISAASSIIDADMKRPQACFWPVIDTRYFDWLDHQYSLTWRLWLNGNDLAAAPTQVLSGGVDITSGILARNGTDDSVPPFHYLEVNLGSDATFMATDTYQRAISVTGLYLACPPAETSGGTLAPVGTTDTTAVCSNGTAVGVGSVVRVDAERMLVTGKAPASSGQTLQVDMGATSNANTVAVSNGALFFAGETLTIDGEQMLIMAVAGNNLLVKRQMFGTPLAQHLTGATVYVSRLLTLTRAALGTTAASHAANAPVFVHVVPAAVQTLALAETLRLLGIERAGYTMVIERGSLTKISTADTLWAQVRTPYQRKMRVRAPARHI